MSTGALAADWAPAFAAVDRAAFLPPLMWPFLPAPALTAADRTQHLVAGAVPVDRGSDPDAWHRYADSDVSIVTQWDDGAHSGEGPGTVATSSSSMPTVVFTLLRHLDADTGMRVLDAGTGTGETAGLLAHRCGRRRVTSIDVDPDVAVAARGRLCALGLDAEVIAGDALAGHRGGGPYDRLLCTFGVRAIPPAWLAQVRPGGISVAPYGTHYSSRDAAVRLTVHADGTASGPFVAGVEFMKARSHRTVWPEHAEYVTRTPGATGTTVQPYELADTDAAHAVALAVPGIAHTAYRTADGADAVFFYSLTDRSWASVRWPEELGPGIVLQDGPRRLWDRVEAAYTWWQDEGRPALTRFGLTITPTGATPWLDNPGRPIPGTGRR
ncbi:methyltransferase domain-containing protein [Streptomyces sp. NPDC002054]|uniref:methyltransferase domain-containing protein n=1 Tax=Streptomyces sp. NPDC002054 TaxID=3154663 RepID=UPI00332D71C6